MTKKLFIQALTKFVAGLAIVMALLFIPAGTLSYWQAWLFISILFVPMLIVGIVLMIRNPELLRKRLDTKENEGEQKSVVAMSSLLFVAMFVMLPNHQLHVRRTGLEGCASLDRIIGTCLCGIRTM